MRSCGMSEWTRERILAEADAIRAKDLADDRRAAIADGREVVTPSAAEILFAKSRTRIRGAARSGEIVTRFQIGLAGKVLRVYSLASCIELWGEPDVAVLERLRRRAEVVAMSEIDAEGLTIWAILTERPFLPSYEKLGSEA